MKHLATIFLLLMSLRHSELALGAANLSPAESVLMISVASQNWDYHNPWSKREPQTNQSLGTVLEGDLILTTALAVRNATSIEGRRFGGSQRFELEIVQVDYEVNLAMLRPRNRSVLSGMRPLTLAKALPAGSDVRILKDRDPFRVSAIAARVSEVSVLRSVTSVYAAAVYILETKGLGLGWGEPVVASGLLAGISSGQDENGVYAIPAPLIARFESMVRHLPYRGFPALGIIAKPLTDPNLRALLGAQKYSGGVRIAKIYEISPFAGKLKEDDVLLKVGGHELSAYGDVSWPIWGRMPLQVILNSLEVGAKTSVSVFRGGKEMSFEGELSRFDSNRFIVPFSRIGETEPFLIFGGLLFQELSRDYLQLWGKEWTENAPTELLTAAEWSNVPPAAPGKHIIFLNRVLADDFNRGYDGIDNVILETCNGQKVESLDDLRKALASPLTRAGKRFAAFTFRGPGGEIVLTYEGLQEAHTRMAKSYGISDLSGFFAPGR